MKKFGVSTKFVRNYAHPLLKEKMADFHAKDDKYVPDKYQKASSRPLINWTKIKAFSEARYPGIETFPIVQQKKMRPEWKPLSESLVDKKLKYMNGVTEEECFEAGVSDNIKKAFSWETASQAELRKKEIQKAVLRFGKFSGDSGSSPVQIAVLTIKIRHLENFLKSRKKDHQNKRHLGKLKKIRKGLLKYLLHRNSQEYYETLKTLKLPMTLEGPVFI